MGHHVPAEVSVECTYRCNLRCVHCNVRCLERPGEAELSAAELADILQQLKDAGTRTLTLTGGEPFLRDDWAEVATRAAELFELIVYTNGTTVTADVAAELGRIGPASVEVSVYGASPGTCEAVTGIEGAYERFNRGLERLMATGLEVVPKVWVLRENAHEWPQLRRRYSAFPAFKRGLEVSPRFDGDASSTAHRASATQMLWVLSAEKHDPRHKKVHKADADKAPCGTASGGCVVSAYGDVFPCGFIPRPGGNLREQSFAEIWQCGFFQKLRSLTLGDLDGCADCELRPYCRVCPGMNLLETGDLQSPAPESCRLARLRRLVAEDGR